MTSNFLAKKLLVFLSLFLASPAVAQTLSAVVVSSCGSPPQTYTAGQFQPATIDTNGNFCNNGSGGGGGAVTQGTTPWLEAIDPTSSASIGIAPIVSAAGEASHVLKAGAGNLYSAYATNLTATAGFLVVINATSAPADGAITPLACAVLPPNGVASVNYSPGPPGVFSTGITAVVSSAATCFTKTTGVITAFISGQVK